MKLKNIALVAITSVIITAAIKAVPAHADSFSMGSLGSLAGIELSSTQQKAAKALIGNRDVDADWAAAYDKKSWDDEFNADDLRYMACIIYCEASGMGFDARAGVGNVVLNRMRNSEGSSGWGHANTVKDVIYDRGPGGKWGVQFSPTSGSNSQMSKALKIYDSMDPDKYKAWQIETMSECIEVAKAVFMGYKSVPDNFYYFRQNTDKVQSSREDSGLSYRIIEKHIYYTTRTD